jgi:hypothetical protein
MRRAGAGFGGSVVISVVATLLLLIAVSGARRPVVLEARGRPPWPAPSSDARVPAAGTADFVVTRFAVHLDVLYGGKPVIVPAGVGSAGDGLFTTDASGIVHVASDQQAPEFTLGQFFTEWQVPLGAATAYVNGHLVRGAPGAVVLAPHQEIAISYGAGGPVPDRFKFPAGT